MLFNLYVKYTSRHLCLREMQNVIPKYCILYFPIPHNTLCLPPKFCTSYCCEILLGIYRLPKRISQQYIVNTKFGGQTECIMGNWKKENCASLLRTIFASLARAHERVHIHKIRDFPQTKLGSEINARFLLNEHGDRYFLFHNLNENSILNN